MSKIFKIMSILPRLLGCTLGHSPEFSCQSGQAPGQAKLKTL